MGTFPASSLFSTAFLSASPVSSGYGSSSPLQQSSLLQSSFLYSHLLLPTLYSALTPQSFKNRTNSVKFQNYLAKNQDVISAINQNITDVIKQSYRRNGKIYEEDNEENCRRKRSLAYSVTSVQGTLLGLQESVFKDFLKRPLANEVRDLVTSMLSHIGNQKKHLEKIKLAQIRVDEEDTRERRTTTRCREPFFPLGRECFYVGRKQKLGWHESKAACHKLQAHLAEPEKPRELARALQGIKGHFNRCWIGGSDEEKEGDWKWLSGGSLVGSQDWRPGQPSNYSLRGEIQDCLTILKNSQKGPPLDDFSCMAERAFVCETEPEC